MLNFESDIEVVGQAEDGNQAISMADALLPDVVLLDVNMPEKNGLDALPAIRAKHPQTKVLILSGLDHVHLRTQTTELGAVDYIVKGTPMNEIAERIRLAVGVGHI